jgi:hypothetical protein
MTSDPFRRDRHPSFYEDRVRVRPRERGDLAAAGVYLAAGRWEVVALGGAAERLLVDAGALLVAAVTFDGAPVPALVGGVGYPTGPGALLPWPS